MSRVRLLVALERSGVDLTRLAEAVHEDRLSLAFAGEVLAEPVGLTSKRHDDALTELALEPGFVERLELALGLPTSSPDDLVREDDFELLALIAQARKAGLTEEALLRGLRVFGHGVRQIVEAQRDLFRENVEERLLAHGMTYRDMLDTAARTRLQLQKIGYRSVFLLLRRFLEQAVFENLVERIEEMLEEHGIARSSEASLQTIVFVDLSGYTSATEEAGDRQAAEQAGRLVGIAQDLCARYGGRLVKSLGDGVMLRFPEARGAVKATLGLMVAADAGGLPPVRAGMAAGAVIQRDGDYFGRIVNLAARLTDAAAPGQILATAELAAAVEDPEIAFRPAGSRALAGFTESIPVFAASRSARAADDAGRREGVSHLTATLGGDLDHGL